MQRKVAVYVKSRGAALIRGAATNREFTVHTVKTIHGSVKCVENNFMTIFISFTF